MIAQYIDPKDIIYIRINDKILSTFEFKETYKERICLFKTKTHINCYVKFGTVYNLEKILSNHDSDGQLIYLVEKNIIYYRPTVRIQTNSNNYYLRFDTFQQAKQHVDEFIKINNISDKLVNIN